MIPYSQIRNREMIPHLEVPEWKQAAKTARLPIATDESKGTLGAPRSKTLKFEATNEAADLPPAEHYDKSNTQGNVWTRIYKVASVIFWKAEAGPSGYKRTQPDTKGRKQSAASRAIQLHTDNTPQSRWQRSQHKRNKRAANNSKVTTLPLSACLNKQAKSKIKSDDPPPGIETIPIPGSQKLGIPNSRKTRSKQSNNSYHLVSSVIKAPLASGSRQGVYSHISPFHMKFHEVSFTFKISTNLANDLLTPQFISNACILHL